MRRAFITGISGQDGSYLAEFLAEKGYQVHGLARQAGAATHFILHEGDLTDSVSLLRVLKAVQPEEIYNLAAQTHVRVSFDNPETTMDVNATGTIRLLEAIRKSEIKTRFCQATTSEMFGSARETPQTEQTQFHPRNPYAVSKVATYWATINYREAHHFHASNAILFNHESPRRRGDFVTRKITRAIGCILAGLQDKLSLGNLDTKRDWGYAKEYVEAMWLMLQQDQPDDYIIATGEVHSVREFLEAAFEYAGLDWKKHVEFDPRFMRPAEGSVLVGDSSKARKQFGWQPKTTFKELVKLMVDADIALLKAQSDPAA